MKFRTNRYLNLFVVNLRFLIGFGFLPSGIKKIVDTPFANLGNGGAFFNFLDALYYTGFYYNFIGWAQLIAAVLLLTQRFAALGALIFFPIILNISILTLSTIGSLTPLIATSMLAGITFLLLWDYRKWINIIYPDTHFITPTKPVESPGYHWRWIVAGFLILILGLLLSFVIENHQSLPRASRLMAIVILLGISIPIITFAIDEFQYRRKKIIPVK